MTRVKFAANTSVSVERSRAEVETTLTRYGADAFGYMSDGPLVKIAFRMAGKHYRFQVAMPDRGLAIFTQYSRGTRAPEAARAAWEQACRQKWRALALVIKAKLEAVDAGISTAEDEFLAHMVLPDKSTVSEFMAPQIAEAYRIGAMPKTLQLEGPRND